MRTSNNVFVNERRTCRAPSVMASLRTVPILIVVYSSQLMMHEQQQQNNINAQLCQTQNPKQPTTNDSIIMKLSHAATKKKWFCYYLLYLLWFFFRQPSGGDDNGYCRVASVIVLGREETMGQAGRGMVHDDNNEPKEEEEEEDLALMPSSESTLPPPKLAASSSSRLEIHGAFSHTSEPMFITNGNPMDDRTSPTTAVALFESQEIVELLISGGGSQKLHHVDMTLEYRKLWADVCEPIVTSNNNNNKDDGDGTNNIQLLVTEVEVKFPGLRVVTESLTGVQKVVLAPPSSTAPAPSGDDDEQEEVILVSYQYCLLAQKQRGFGMPLAVWVFNRIMGNNRPETGEEEKRDFDCPAHGRSVSTVSLVEKKKKTGDNNNDTAANTSTSGTALFISFDCWVELTYPFPEMLVRLSKMRIENILTTAITNMAQKEVRKGVSAAHQAMVLNMTTTASSSSSSSENIGDDGEGDTAASTVPRPRDTSDSGDEL